MKNTRLFPLTKILSGILMLSLFSAISYADNITVMHPYVRAVPQGQPNSAAFMVLKNTSAEDRDLVKARSTVSAVVELHTHIMDGGMMRMRQVDKISIKAGGETVLEPGGLHVMFLGLKQELNAGEKVDLELEFDDGAIIKLTVPVKMVAGMQMKKMH